MYWKTFIAGNASLMDASKRFSSSNTFTVGIISNPVPIAFKHDLVE
jgi:hypothetical protein